MFDFTHVSNTVSAKMDVIHIQSCSMTRILSYKRLWHLLIDKNLKKTDLKQMTHLSSTTLAHLSANKPVNLEVLLRICDALDCELADIVETHKQSPVGQA